jgi:predicted GNAT family N-acyltransferase
MRGAQGGVHVLDQGLQVSQQRHERRPCQVSAQAFVSGG